MGCVRDAACCTSANSHPPPLLRTSQQLRLFSGSPKSSESFANLHLYCSLGWRPVFSEFISVSFSRLKASAFRICICTALSAGGRCFPNLHMYCCIALSAGGQASVVFSRLEASERDQQGQQCVEHKFP